MVAFRWAYSRAGSAGQFWCSWGAAISVVDGRVGITTSNSMVNEPVSRRRVELLSHAYVARASKPR